MAVCFAVFITTSWADQLIVEPDMGRKPIINVLLRAKKSVKLVMYGFTDQAFLKALIRQKQSGREVKVLLEKSPYKTAKENHKIISRFKSSHIEWQGCPTVYRFLHEKSLIVDGKEAVIMTFNFTRSAFKNMRNFALLIDDPVQVQQINAVFDADWNHTRPILTANSIILGPENGRNKLLEFLRKTKHSLNVYAQNISDYQIVNELAKLALRGAKVQVLTSTRLDEKKEKYLLHNGVEIHYTHKIKIHAKVLIMDNAEAVIGSVNLTYSSISKNRELAIVTDNKSIVNQLSLIFSRDWKV